MVSAHTFFKAVAVASAAIVSAEPLGYKVLDRVPLMPRIPSQAKHYEVLQARSEMEVDHSTLANLECVDPSQGIILHDETIAQLSICGGMPGSVDRCEGTPTETFGEAGTAVFAVRAIDAGAYINITKKQWMRCVQAARDQCPTGSISATCVGGGSTGDVSFTLERPQSHDL